MSRKAQRFVGQAIVVLLVILILPLYRVVPPFRNLLDKPLDFATAGIVVAYSKLSTAVYERTGLDLGLIERRADPDFLFNVQVAEYVNERKAAPLLDMAENATLSQSARESALLALLKFDSTADWIQPFLNELPKGGLPGVYDESAPAMDALLHQIRREGGVQQGLVRAYADSVFSFMLQHPKEIIRTHAMQWVTDALTEDSIYLIIPRIYKEKDPGVRKEIEEALWKVPAISNPLQARQIVRQAFLRAPWPEIRLPLAYLLVSLGGDKGQQLLQDAIANGKLTGDRKLLVSLALDHKRFPEHWFISNDLKEEIVERRRARQAQIKVALMKQQQYRAQAAAAKPVETPVVVAMATPLATPPQPAATPSHYTPQVAESKTPTPQATPKKTPPQQVAMVPVPPAPPVVPPVAPSVPRARPSVEKPKPTPTPKPTAIPTPEVQPEESVAPPPPTPAPAKPTPAPTPTPKPKPTPPPISPTDMQPVDMVFEAESQEVPLYSEPGFNQITGVILPVGTKGQAIFRVTVGPDAWYQVKSKKGSGWANGSLLTVFDLGNGGAPTQKPRENSEAPTREEKTYFQPIGAGIAVFVQADEASEKIATLTEGTAYLAKGSKKVGTDRWFLLELPQGGQGWSRGYELQLADVPQPVQTEKSDNTLTQRGKKSAFAAEWVMASIKDAAIYKKPSIAGSPIKTMTPAKVYKVVDTSEGNGSEWYKIEIDGGKIGWVQSMDVKLTKPQ